MKALFKSSPHRVRQSNSRDSTDAAAATAAAAAVARSTEEANNRRRAAFAFMKYSPDRRSSASMKASREHAKQIALKLSLNEQPEAAPSMSFAAFPATTPTTTTSAFPTPSTRDLDGFDPFGHGGGGGASAAAFPVHEDFFAAAPAAFPTTTSTRPASSLHRKSSNASSHRSATSSVSSSGHFHRDNSFDNESVMSSGAYDMDMLPIQQQQQLQLQQQQQQQRRASRGRPPRNKAPSSEVSFGSVSASSSHQWSQQPPPPPPPPPPPHPSSTPNKSMSTFPSNSSMQASFATASASAPTTPRQQPQQPVMIMSQQSPIMGSGGGGGAAARRRMRSQMRLGSSNSSVQGSDAGSVDGTPPASPMTGRRINISNSNVSVGSSNGNGFSNNSNNNNGGFRNRVSSYNTISGGGGGGGSGNNGSSNWQHSPSPSMRGSANSGASVCSSVAESDFDLFDTQNEGGGFTFDAFGLDASEIDREVQEAMHALAGSGHSSFGGFIAAATMTSSSANSVSASAASVNASTTNKPQDTSTDDFAPQAWDSPPGSRRSTPTPSRDKQLQDEEDDDGFVDGFRISKQSPLPLVSVRRHNASPASSERSSSVSSITDQNNDHGVPRRNVFKEKAGFLSSATNNPVRRHRPSPAQQQQYQQQTTSKKQWVPPPGAVKMLTPPRRDSVQRQQQIHKQRQQQQQQQSIQPTSTEEETDNYWGSQLKQIPNMFPEDEPVFEQPKQETKQQLKFPAFTEASTAKNNQWKSAAAKFMSPSQPGMPQPAKKYVRESSFRKQPKQQPEEKKDDDTGSEDPDSHTDTTAAMTTVVSESQPQQTSPREPLRPAQVQPRQLQQEPLTMSQKQQQEQPAKLVAPLKRENLEKLETEMRGGTEQPEKVLSPQEQRRRELEQLRSGGASASPIESTNGFKTAAMLNHVHHDAKTLKPQQERVNECSDQRTSFASFRERLKSPVDHDQNKANVSSTPQSSSEYFRGQISPQSSSATKSEVGVSSFTLQKMKIASLSSAAKSEASYKSSPRISQPKVEVNAAVNRMRGGMNMDLANRTPKPGFTQNGGAAPAPAFLNVKLRKTSSGLQSSSTDTDQDFNGSPSADSQEKQQQQQHPETINAVESTRQLSYREQREMELRELEEELQSQSSTRPMSQAQKMAQLQQQKQLMRHPQSAHDDGQDQDSRLQEQQRVPSPKRLSYRERRELELAKEREMQQQQEDHKSQHPPKRDVADLIRRRIAANKSKNSSSPSNESLEEEAVSMGRGRLRSTGISIEDNDVRQANSSASDDRSKYTSQDEYYTDQQDYRESYQQDSRVHYDEQPKQSAPQHSVSPRHLQPLTQRYHDDHDQHQAQQQQQKEPSMPSSGGGGLSALHAQLKQLKGLQTGEEEHEQPEAPSQEQAQEQKISSKRVQAMVDARADYDVTVAHSHSSEQHSSPTRTPKATYAMLNAFLHGREAITAAEDKPTPAKADENEEETTGSTGSPPKASTNSASPRASGPALKDDPKYARYFTMLKIGMPMDVVKHAMLRDNLDPNVMDGDHNRPACTGIPLKDDPKYAKYFKMLKIGMPMEAVKHAMERDGLDSHVMDQDHNMPADPSKGKTEDAPKEKDSHRRARLHWKPLREVRRNSLWAKIDEDPALDNIEIDEEEFAELFQAELQPESHQGTQGKRVKSPRKGAAVRVIDPKRANNGGIILARLKMSHDDMADVVDRIDENCMTAEQIEHIIEYLPSRDERRALEGYMLEGGQDAAEKFDGLCECEKFMVSMMTVKHAKRKVRALLFKLQFESCLEALYQETSIVETSCDELSNSVRLRQLLGIVLTFGNRLNTAGKGKKKKAGAFTLDSLLKLNQAKAFDKKTTFLQYIVLIVQRNNELLLRFKDDLPTVFKADKVYWDQCILDLEEVENQLENVRRIALYQARQAAKFRRRKKKQHQHEGDDEEESLSDMSLSLEEEVEALRSTPIGLFTLSAIKKVSFLRDRVEGTKIKFHKLLEYFGEDEKHMQPHELFNIIVKFCRDFDKAKEQVFAEEKKKKREERKRQSANSNAQTPNKTPGRKPPQHSPGMMRLSSMQPNASRLIDDMKRSSRAFSNNNVSGVAEPKHTVEQDHNNVESRSESTPGGAYHQSQNHNSNLDQLSSPSNISPRRASAPAASPPRQALDGQEQMPKNSVKAPPQSSPRQHTTNQQDIPERQEYSRDISVAPSSNSQDYHHHPRNHTSDLPDSESYSSSLPQSQEQSSRLSMSQQPRGQGLQSFDLQDVMPQDVIPRGMQDQGRMEIPFECAAVPPLKDDQGTSAMDTSTSFDAQNSAALRRKARMRRGRAGVSPLEEPQSNKEMNAPQTPSHTVHAMDRQNSAPITVSDADPTPDRSYERRSSAPLENSSNGAGQQGYNTSSSLVRNKLRSKRIMEQRKHRAMGRQSPPPGAV